MRNVNIKFKNLLLAAFILIALSLLTLAPVAKAEQPDEECGACVITAEETRQFATFSEAIMYANTLEAVEVKLLKNGTLDDKLNVSGNITVNGNGFKLTRAESFTGTFFAVSAGASLTLDGNLTIDGGNDYIFDRKLYDADAAEYDKSIPKSEAEKWFTPKEGAPVATAYMITTSGTVNLNEVTVKNNYSKGSGVVSATAGSTVTLDGATITHNANTQGSGLVVNASGANIKITVEDGTLIDGNHVGGNHGIFKIYSGAELAVNGGEILNTTGWNSNGVVIGIYYASVEINGGKITNNKGVYGPSNGRNAAIYCHRGSQFTMNGGEVSFNSGRGYGGIDGPYSTDYGSNIVINGGAFISNESRGGFANADVNASNSLTINGGEFSQDITKWLADDAYLEYDEKSDTYLTAKCPQTDMLIEIEDKENGTVKRYRTAKNDALSSVVADYASDACIANSYAEFYATAIYDEESQEYSYSDKLSYDATFNGDVSLYTVYAHWVELADITQYVSVKNSGPFYYDYGRPVTLEWTQSPDSPVSFIAIYENNVNAGRATLTIKAESFDIQKKYNFSILPIDISKAKSTVVLGDDLTYNGLEQTQKVETVSVNGNPVTFEVEGNTALAAGDYTLTVTGNGNFTGTVNVCFTVKEKPLSLKPTIYMLSGLIFIEIVILFIRIIRMRKFKSHACSFIPILAFPPVLANELIITAILWLVSVGLGIAVAIAFIKGSKS